ncbi:MAG: GNAT family N-acetyltransferase [Defluviitaleaceae bacterium]|nr:GNAT family N-acetyltransferase [Defluviitaleaceae bacterium]
MEIIELLAKDWQGYLLPFRYTAYEYYDVNIARNDSDFNVHFTKKPLDKPYEKMPNDDEKLFRPWWENVQAWGIVEDGKLLAAIETAVEEWNNRLIITELWVDDSIRRQGIAKRLMDKAMGRARAENRRAVMLETQSCNAPAIEFYLNYGFALMGFDACAYQNNDIERKEVRMEFGILLK